MCGGERVRRAKRVSDSHTINMCSALESVVRVSKHPHITGPFPAAAGSVAYCNRPECGAGGRRIMLGFMHLN